jgi:hypothetical protein
VAVLKAPPWTIKNLDPDDDGNRALVAWVKQEIARPENKALHDEYLLFDDPEGAWADLGAAIQGAAVKAARNNDPRRLANLLDEKRELPRSRSSRNQRGVGIRPLKPLTICPEMRVYLAELVRRQPKRRGPATHPDTQATRDDTKRHVKLVEIILQREYKAQKPAQIRDRAIEVVAAIRGMDAGTIANFFKKSKTERPNSGN